MNGTPVPEKCILVVDDCIDNLYLMQFILEIQGYQVWLASSGAEALNQIDRQQPDLILLDVMMPQMSGYELVQELRKNAQWHFIPVILVTADKYVSCSEAIAVGANGLIYKPVDIERLLTEIARSFELNDKCINN